MGVRARISAASAPYDRIATAPADNQTDLETGLDNQVRRPGSRSAQFAFLLAGLEMSDTIAAVRSVSWS